MINSLFVSVLRFVFWSILQVLFSSFSAYVIDPPSPSKRIITKVYPFRKKSYLVELLRERKSTSKRTCHCRIIYRSPSKNTSWQLQNKGLKGRQVRIRCLKGLWFGRQFSHNQPRGFWGLTHDRWKKQLDNSVDFEKCWKMSVQLQTLAWWRRERTSQTECIL